MLTCRKIGEKFVDKFPGECVPTLEVNGELGGARTGEVEPAPTCLITDSAAAMFGVPVNVGVPIRSANICPNASQSFSTSACPYNQHPILFTITIKNFLII